MRLRPGRPDLSDHAALFDVPAAGDDDGPHVTFLGVSTLLFDDGSSALMTDGFFSRPGLFSVLARPLKPDRERIAACLRRAARAGSRRWCPCTRTTTTCSTAPRSRN